MNRWLWALYGAVALVLAGVYLRVPEGSAAEAGLLLLAGAPAVTAVVAGTRRHRPAARGAWLLLASGLAASLAGDVLHDLHHVLAGTEPPLLWWSDAPDLAGYGLVLGGLWLLVRARAGQEGASQIDALVLACGLGLPVWVFLVAPLLAEPGPAGAAAQLVAVAYPLADVALVAGVARLWWSPGARPPSLALLGLGALPLLVADLAHVAEAQDALGLPEHGLEAGWLLWAAGWGAAALHPSMTDVTSGAPPQPGRLPAGRAVALGVAALSAPAVLLVQGLLGTEVATAPVAAAFVLLTALVTLRVAGLVGALSASVARQRGQEHFRALVHGGSDLITLVRPDGVVTYESPSVERLLGTGPEDLVGRPLVEVVHPDDRARLVAHLEAVLAGEPVTGVELRLPAADGTWHWVESLGGRISGDGDGVVLTSRDVTDRRALQEQLTQQALHDPLTGLANRRLFTDRVEQALARRGDGLVAVLFIDLDDFKTVNDSLGHAAGDALLTEAARRLTSAVRSGDSVARLGGDEFAVLLDTDVEADTGEAIAERLVELLREPARVGDTAVVPQASVGVATARVGSDPDELLRNADLAMYMAKGSGKSRAQVFQPEMYAATLGRLELVADLRRALEREEFRLHYQPTVRIDTGAVTGVEALARWQHPTRGLVNPGQFIPLAEETGLIVPLSRWVLATACTAAADWAVPVEGVPVTLSVNLSPRHLASRSVIEDVALALAESGLDPARLVLEITESGLLDDSAEIVGILEGLKGLGVRLAVDDFGTGYSSLSYLRRFPIDVLKVDKSFVDGLGLEGEATAMVRAILELARSMNMTTVAEGIEVGHQLEELAALGCDLGQGFLLSRPLLPERLVALLAEQSRPRTEQSRPRTEQGRPRAGLASR